VILQDADQVEDEPCYVVLTTPTHRESATSATCDQSDVASYPVGFSVTSKHSEKDADKVLEQLLSKPLCIQIFLGGQEMGATELDLLPAATSGAHTVEARLDLRPTQLDSEKNEAKRRLSQSQQTYWTQALKRRVKHSALSSLSKQKQGQ
jgi:hypothetical protein